jgi:hypothetical protein
MKVFHRVGSVADARRAAAAGVDVLHDLIEEARQISAPRLLGLVQPA